MRVGRFNQENLVRFLCLPHQRGQSGCRFFGIPSVIDYYYRYPYRTVCGRRSYDQLEDGAHNAVKWQCPTLSLFETRQPSFELAKSIEQFRQFVHNRCRIPSDMARLEKALHPTKRLCFVVLRRKADLQTVETFTHTSQGFIQLRLHSQRPSCSELDGALRQQRRSLAQLDNLDYRAIRPSDIRQAVKANSKSG